MKRFIVSVIAVFVMFCFVSIAFAGAWKSSETYETYKTTKAKAIAADDEGNTVVAVSNFLEAAKMAETDATTEIQAWQLNSAAYSLIKKFKSGIKDKALLTEAMTYLNQAKALNADATLDKIQSNIDFCNVWLDVK